MLQKIDGSLVEQGSAGTCYIQEIANTSKWVKERSCRSCRWMLDPRPCRQCKANHMACGGLSDKRNSELRMNPDRLIVEAF